MAHHPLHLALCLASRATLAMTSLALATGPAGAQKIQGEASEGLSSKGANPAPEEVALKNAVKLNYGIQGQLQGAGTPNEAGMGIFLPLTVGKNTASYVDVLVNYNSQDYRNYSSIGDSNGAGEGINGYSISTSTRLGYRWLNGNSSWMYGFNAGYDSRQLSYTRQTSTRNNSNPVLFQQVTVELEAVSNTLNAKAYALVPVGPSKYQLRDTYAGSSLNTYGLDVGYSITPDLSASIGYYHQNSGLSNTDGSGVAGRIAYNLSNGVTLGFNISYDQLFETRVSGDIKLRFGSNGYGAPSKRSQQPALQPTIQALSGTPTKRNIRVIAQN